MQANQSPLPLEMWGGIECTRNRVGEAFYDQTEWNGHVRRPDDLDRLAELGLSTLRYPALWEWAVDQSQSYFDWTWADTRLQRLTRLAMRPIVGFVHHGSGPRSTDLLAPDFASGLQVYAEAFAQRFPDIDLYTPINEPLTTARFSSLYGHWYPHARDDLSFVKTLLNECRATVDAMRAIRAVRPDAKLVQTEDMGKTFCSPSLTYQADFENHRRWLTFDLLEGKVDQHHPLGDYLRWAGLPKSELQWFCDNPCPPDILGLNYYVTSERYLARRPGKQTGDEQDGNRRHRYADLEAVRIRPTGLFGIRALLLEAWERYRRPLAVTEAHLGCGREDQLRWLWEIWQEATAARNDGVDVRAVTAWALLGSYDWNSLVTKPVGHYEPGAFDVRGPVPRRTALATLISELSAGQQPSHPVLKQPGWWRRSLRLRYPRRYAQQSLREELPTNAPILITGAVGKLGQAFARICGLRGLPHVFLSRQDLDATDSSAIEAALDRVRPWALINTAGYITFEDAEQNEEQCYRENVLEPITLATACRRHSLPLMMFSSDLVFDGRQRTPYGESDPTNPLGVYGRAQLVGEQKVLDALPSAMIVRSSSFFCPWDEHNFVTRSFRAFEQGAPCLVAEYTVSPTYVPDLVHVCLDLLVDGESGVWHLAGDGEISWSDLAAEIARRMKLQRRRLDVRFQSQQAALTRPIYSALRSERGMKLPRWDDGLDRYFKELQVCRASHIS